MSCLKTLLFQKLKSSAKTPNAKQTLYFYREYGGREIDVIIEDYKKNYTALEIKITGDKTKDFFPLPHTFETINTSNYFEIISRSIGSTNK